MSALDLDDDVERRLADVLDDVRADPTRIRTRFPAAAREVGRTPAGESATPGESRVEDLVRVRLLGALGEALADQPDRLAQEVADLYRFGDAGERRAVLLGLGVLVDAGQTEPAATLVHDALRTNDVRLVAAALSTAGAGVLDTDAFRQAVLKCLFVGVPLDLVAGLDERVDPELLRMVESYAEERRAAGREVPVDAVHLLTRHGHDSGGTTEPTPMTES